MRLTLYFFGLLCCLLSCRQPKKINATDLIKASIQAHGGLENWQSLRNVSYQKRIVLYLPDGKVESDVIQNISYRFKPKFSGEMKWEKDSIPYRVVFDGSESQVFINGIPVQDSTSIAKYTTDLMASYYVFAQPFKLLEEDAVRTYEGRTTLEGGELADVVKITYPNSGDVPSDEWWYFFDVRNHRLLANMVHHQKKYSYIKNTLYQTEKSFLFNAQRKSYQVDRLRTIQYLRADYFLKKFQVE